MKFVILLLLICTGFLSCNRKKINNKRIWDCNAAQKLDSADISTKLLGSWIWEKQYHSWSNETKKADKKIIVNFSSDQSFTVHENSDTLAKGTWKLKIVDANSWGLDLKPFNQYIIGRILFCKAQILFNNSYIDGHDNLFSRVKK